MVGRGRLGRPKAGTSRMDAAVGAMKKFGFEEKLTKLTVRELLKLYGGIEGWPLIEDDCYGTLLEILLKKNQEEEGVGEQSRPNNQEGADQPEGADQLEGGNQPEQTMVLEQHVETTPEPPNDAGPPPSDITDNASGAETENTGMEEFGGGDENLEATPMISDDINLPLTIPPPQPPVEPITKQRRKPFYGWISDDDDDDDEGNVAEGNVGVGNVDEGNVDEGNVAEGNVGVGNVAEGNVAEGNVGVGNVDEGNVDEGNVDDVLCVPARVLEKRRRKSRWDVTPN